MKKRKPGKKSKRNDLEDFEALAPYLARIANGNLRRHTLFSLCVRASVAKCFEFNLAARKFAKFEGAFFAISSLRGICEDLIVLRFISTIPSADREQLLHGLKDAELATRTKFQGAFFSAIRPQQPVLRLKEPDTAIAASEAVARAIWNRHGWPNLHKGMMPNIRQIAEKQGMDQLAVLYDYFYRLTSAGVHFNVQSLLRSGWGKNKSQFTFSTKNFHEYFSRYCSVYGAFMFCLYFEFFGSTLRPAAEERAHIEEIREHVLFTSRWPEMVTFEEMNMKPPTGGETLRAVVSAFQAVLRKRLIGKNVDYNNEKNAERRQISKLLGLFAPRKNARREKAHRKTAPRIARTQK